VTTGSDDPAPLTLETRLAGVREGVSDAVRLAGRDPSEITTIVVTKFHPASLVRDLFALGVRDFGENRHQDASPKAAELADLAPHWHFVGQLQSKKAKQVLGYARTIHSVDRSSLVDVLAASELEAEVFLQLNLTDDPARGGVDPQRVRALAEEVLRIDRLRLLGVMAVAPLGAEPRAAFAAVREASDHVRELAPNARFLSMGMSNDYREAILEGATHLRIGTAITGNRPVDG
jgi:pyridoxal phosphate enzyme (YggS family)